MLQCPKCGHRTTAFSGQTVIHGRCPEKGRNAAPTYGVVTNERKEDPPKQAR